ncbi:leucine-rich repeat-containing protein 48 [Culex quinquefasciatus]|uniref:Dynein axonemal assembly factor 1 homolog n=1 Tax=Culex quinquefasciatus TaxID=7176 RepID=B0X2M1_CULQU|nr:leucine-rich repeat-containing protein 48 [Culex quinquefasciatus]|eukprot:XP_001863893.1 leucine-rich repeat-containing protein 48 [Culex quinquefasciatus]
MSKKLAAENSIHKEQEPGVINNDMLTKAIIEQGHKGEAGRLARMDQVQLEAITVIRLEFQNILKIDHLWVLKNLEVLSLAFNKIDKIENLHRLAKLKELNLSFNFIEKIENLDKLIRLRTLSIFGNRIAKLQNLDHLENLVILSAGKNNIATLDGIERLRFLKDLRSLNLAENPIATDGSKPLRLYVACLLPQLKYYQYVLIKPEERTAGKEMFSREIQDILELEKYEIVERERSAKEKADEVYLSKSFVEHLNGHQLFSSLFTGDPDGEALLAIGNDALELKNEYQAEAYGFTQKIYKIGLEQYERRQEELKLYNSCIDSERKKAQKLGQDIINHFLEVYNRLCPRVKQIVISMDRDALKHVESLSAHHALQPLLDELELAKDEFNSVFEDSWHTLMNIEMQLFERTEEGNSNFENTIKEMTNEFIEQAQAQFVLLREAETSFSEALIGVVQQFVTFKAASGHAHEIPRALQEALEDKDVIGNLAAGMRDSHMQLIDAREDKLINRSRTWVRELCDGLQNSEIKRNRAKVLEITYFLDQHRQYFYALFEEVIPTQGERKSVTARVQFTVDNN